MKISKIREYTAISDSGAITIDNGRSSKFVELGSSVQLVDSSDIKLYWLSSTGLLKRADISSSLLITNQEILASGVLSFSVKEITGVGISYAYITNNMLHINVLGSVFTSPWAAERLLDFSYDISDDFKTISILYMRPGSPVQAFIEYYIIEEGTDPEEPGTYYYIPSSPTTVYYHVYKEKFLNY